MAKKLHPSRTSPSAIQSVTCSGVKHATSGDTFSGVKNHTSPSGNLMDKWCCPGNCQTQTCLTALCHCVNHGRGGIIVWGCFSGVGLGALVPVKGTDLGPFHAPNFVGIVWRWLCFPLHNSKITTRILKVIKSIMSFSYR